MNEHVEISGPLPPVLLLVFLILMVVTHLAWPVFRIAAGWRWLGVGFLAAGVLINFWADREFRRAGTAVKPTEPSTSLVLRGPFSFSRNPMYLGLVAILVGAALMLGSALPWLFVPVFIWLVTSRFIVPEERKMQREFGQHYIDYKDQVRRWL